MIKPIGILLEVSVKYLDAAECASETSQGRPLQCLLTIVIKKKKISISVIFNLYVKPRVSL